MSTNEDGYFGYMTADEDDDVGIITDQVEHEYELLTRVTDTSSEQARRGKDIQGIPWDRLHITRENYRRARLEQYNNYDNVHSSGDQIDKEWKQMEKGGNYYEFRYNSRLAKPTILHFQMRNLVWATWKHDVYFTSNTSVMHWSSISCELSEVLNFSRHVAPLERHPGNLVEGISRAQISALAVKDNLLVAGGFQGELTCKVVTSLVGHLDYSFASAWHPDSRTFSTGNQDKTCRVWDIRNLSSSTTVLRGNLGAVRSIRYSSDGRFMVVAEPADFVHIYDTKAGYKMRQELDFFGEISGVSLSPDDESMFVGVWDRVYASMLHYSKKHAYNYLDSFI